jgi:hypothetical protein
MKKLIYLLGLIPLLSLSNCSRKDHHDPFTYVPPTDSLTVADCIRCIVLTDQQAPAIDIVDAGRNGRMMWSWYPGQSGIAGTDVDWFSNPDDAKPVYGGRFLLVNASGGGVALIRVADKKVLFYTHVGKNPHSSALLPDGNIVTASSTDNRLVISHVDTSAGPGQVYQKVISLPFAHNVVWDGRRQLLWSAADNKLYAFTYNFNCRQPDLTLKETFQLPGDDSHDLFPVYGKDSLWLTNPSGVFCVDMHTMKITSVNTSLQANIKSVSSGPPGWPVILMQPRVSWWSDRVLDLQGNIVFLQQGMKIYKARWFLPDAFSYSPADTTVRVCGG